MNKLPMIFLLIVLSVLAFIHGYVGLRIIPTLGLSGPWIITLWILVAVLAILPLAAPFLRFQGLENRLTDSLSWIGYTSLGFFVLTLVVVVARDLGWTAWVGGARLFGWLSGATTDEAADPGRRQFIITAMNLGLVSLTGGISAYGFFRARRKPVVIDVDVPLANLPPGVEGLRIVQISDLHVGPTIKRDFVQRVVDQVRELKPDLIALTGDLVDGSVSWLSDDVAPLSQLEAPYGKYFITGNHEYYSGVEHWLQETERIGFINLVNEHRVIAVNGAKLTLAGVTDYDAGRVLPAHATDPGKALRGAPADSLKILLAHQPSSIYAASKLGVDLQLSGHTHGGQFKPFHLAVKQAHPYVAGLHNHDGTQIYVNVGTGYWGPPLRIGIPNEITVLTLKRA
ncbi:MAG: metallophosphoesterase [Candidatus Neomarinimicrobiota bacterium]